MAAKTQSVAKILEKADNLYEAVLMIAKRARQINSEYYQKKRDHQILEELDGGYEDEFMDQDDEDAATFVEPEDNPISVAQGDFYEGRLEKKYEKNRRR